MASKQGVWSGEAALLTRDGKEIPVSIAMLARENPEGEVDFPANVSREAAERRFLEEQLAHAQTMEVVGQLAGGLAHDFNNLLTPILGFAHFAAERAGDDHQVREYLDELQRVAEQAASLTRQLLVFSRLQKVDQRVLDLNGLILDMENMLRRLIGDDIELATFLSPNPAMVRVDPGLTGQVLVNLAMHARDAMPAGEKLTIETAITALDHAAARALSGLAPGKYVRLSVVDTGTGMDAEAMAHLFEPFYPTGEPGKAGSLSLAVCHSVIQQSGGETVVRSTPGEGTTFELYLPWAWGEHPAESSGVCVSESPRRPVTVLLAEDEPLVRELVSEVLRREGYTVLDAQNGEEALRKAKEYGGENIQLLLTDVVMPVIGGKDLADSLEKLYPNIKILFMSGYSGDILSGYGGEEVQHNLLRKPFTPVELARRIRETLDAPA